MNLKEITQVSTPISVLVSTTDFTLGFNELSSLKIIQITEDVDLSTAAVMRIISRECPNLKVFAGPTITTEGLSDLVRGCKALSALFLEKLTADDRIVPLVADTLNLKAFQVTNGKE